MRCAFCVLVLLSACLCAAGEWSLARCDQCGSRDPMREAIPSWTRGEADTNRIDLLLVFDASARNWLAGQGLEPEGYAKKCVADMNQSLAYTGVDRYFSFRLGGVLDISPVDLGDYELQDVVAPFTTKLSTRRLPHGIVERISRARDDSKADIVAILIVGKTDNIYGYSQSLCVDRLTADGFKIASEQHAYCACRVDSVDTRHVLLHEIGHLLGAGHSDTQRRSPGPQLFPYSSAYRFQAGKTPLTTITGYPEEKDGIILPFFSTPNYVLTYADEDGVVWRDVPVGTTTNDNTRTVVATYPLVVQYRVARPTEPAARFERELAFALAEDGKTVGTVDRAVSMHCGVKHSFSMVGVGDGVVVGAYSLPRGFSYDERLRVLSGRAMVPGNYTSLFSFEDRLGSLYARRRVLFRVTPLPEWVIGEYRTDDGCRRIAISEKGVIRIFSQRGHRMDVTTQRGFAREEKSLDGTPVFLFEDGKRLALSVGVDGEPHGVVTCPDGLVYRRNTEKRGRGRSARRMSKDFKPQTKKQTKEDKP